MAEKRTVLARIRTSLELSEGTLAHFRASSDSWFLEDRGTAFFAEYRSTWRELIVESIKAEAESYFLGLGIPSNRIPGVEVEEEYPGSWIVDAALTAFGTTGTVYTILKGVSELPEIADGLRDLKSRILARFKPSAEQAAADRLARAATTPLGLAPLPLVGGILVVDLVIDARPLLALTPSRLKSHAIHLSIGISRDLITIENLSDTAITNLRVGIFAGRVERQQWMLEEAFLTFVDTLSAKQTIAKSLNDFRNAEAQVLELSSDAVFLDCWVQDQYGIYLFNFFLEEE